MARAGFPRVSAEYERSRPSYPREAIECLCRELDLTGVDRLVELGAGTGKLTRVLLANGLNPVAVEPLEGMVKQLRTAVPGIPVVAGVAEALPFRTGSLDGVLAGQAFHWFRADQAVRELGRVLRPGGGVGLLWNIRDDTVPWQRELTEALESFRPRDSPSHRSRAWVGAFESSPPFEPLAARSFRYDQPTDLAGLFDRVRSVSFVATLSPAESGRLLTEVSSIAERAPRGAGGGLLLRYTTEVHWSQRRAA